MAKKRKETSGRAVALPQLTTQPSIAPAVPAPAFSNDPFAVLHDLCTELILSELSAEDISSCAGVNRQWRGVVHNHVQRGTVIRRHFPQSWELLEDSSGEERLNGFLRHAYQDNAIKLGKATWVRKFENAEGFAVAGDYMAWHTAGGRSFTWQNISQSGARARAAIQENLLFWPNDKKHTHAVDKVLINEDGYMFVRSRVGLGPYSYPPSGNFFPVSKTIERDTVFRLPSTQGLWMRERYCVDFVYSKADRLEPILIGKTRIYLVLPPKEAGQNTPYRPPHLQAHDLLTGECLYQKVLHFDYYGRGHYGRQNPFDAFRLLHFGDREYIINLLLYVPGSHSWGEYPFAIIDGATGGCVQLIKQGKLGESYRVASSRVTAKPGSCDTFALCSKAHLFAPGIMAVIQIFTRKRNGKFAREEIMTVAIPHETVDANPYRQTLHHIPLRAWAINPFALQFFQTQSVGAASGTLTPFTENDVHSQGIPVGWFYGSSNANLLQIILGDLKGYAPVVSHYRVGNMSNVTLPPQPAAKRSKNGRRACPVKANRNVGGRDMALLNGGQRVLLREYELRKQGYGICEQGTKDVYIFDFGAGW